MQLSMLDSTIVLIYLAGIFVLAQWVSREKAGHQQGRQGLLPGQQIPAMVGHRRLADRRQHLGRADHRHVRLRLRHRAGDRLVRMDGGATLLIVGKFFLPVFLRNGIYTMPQFLEQRYGGRIRTLMAVFWLGCTCSST
jgi:SSS family solute:Na+ symporter